MVLSMVMLHTEPVLAMEWGGVGVQGYGLGKNMEARGEDSRDLVHWEGFFCSPHGMWSSELYL